MNDLIPIYFSIKINPYQLLWMIEFKEKCTFCIMNLIKRQTSTTFKLQNINSHISSILVKEPKYERSFFFPLQTRNLWLQIMILFSYSFQI